MTQEQGRFLRDAALREALYYDADGKCQQCGEELTDNWHADHVVPWSANPRDQRIRDAGFVACLQSTKGSCIDGWSS